MYKEDVSLGYCFSQYCTPGIPCVESSGSRSRSSIWLGASFVQSNAAAAVDGAHYFVQFRAERFDGPVIPYSRKNRHRGDSNGSWYGLTYAARRLVLPNSLFAFQEWQCNTC